jgi:uncharacterized protein involved in type VI secretion and phage assembly
MSSRCAPVETGIHAARPAGATYLAEVVSVQDPDGLARVQIRLLAFDGVADHNAPVWARVAVPFAGNNRGSFFLPEVGDEVLVTFAHGDPAHPIVIGSLWNGNDAPPETLGGSGDRIDRWTLVGAAGTRIAIVEENSGEATISLTTPGGVSLVMTQKSGGEIKLEAAGSTIKIDTQGVSISAPGKVKIEASQVSVSAGMVNVDAGMSKFSGVVQCDTLITNCVVSTSYTPGAGNIW